MTMFLKVMITNLMRMLISKHVILWGLKLATKHTDTLIDDNAVLFVEGAYNNDVEKVKKAVEAISKEFLEK